MKTRTSARWSATGALVAALSVSSATAQDNRQGSTQDNRQGSTQENRQGSPQRAQVTVLYEQGQMAIERAQWPRAVERFSTLVSIKAPRADAAMYWRAYALDKMNRQADVLTTVDELAKTYPSSRWLADARALEIQVRQRAGQPISPDLQTDEDLKLYAIQGLQFSEPAQAVPMLEKLLQGAQSPRLKERALFVLAQSSAPRARQVLAEVARGNANPDVQIKAIQYVGMQGSPADGDLLSGIYASAKDVQVKEAAIDALVFQQQAESLVTLARKETDRSLKQRIVQRLSFMRAQPARDYLMELLK